MCTMPRYQPCMVHNPAGTKLGACVLIVAGAASAAA